MCSVLTHCVAGNMWGTIKVRPNLRSPTASPKPLGGSIENENEITGKVIGIVVGSVIGFVILSIIGFFLYKSKNSRKTGPAPDKIKDIDQIYE